MHAHRNGIEIGTQTDKMAVAFGIYICKYIFTYIHTVIYGACTYVSYEMMRRSEAEVTGRRDSKCFVILPRIAPVTETMMLYPPPSRYPALLFFCFVVLGLSVQPCAIVDTTAGGGVTQLLLSLLLQVAVYPTKTPYDPRDLCRGKV